MRWFELLEKVDWEDSSLELSAVEAEPEETLHGTGFGTGLGDVVGFGTGLGESSGLGTVLGTGLGEPPGLGTELGSGLGISSLVDKGLDTALGTALDDVVGLGTGLGESPGLGTGLLTGLDESTLLGDREWSKRYRRLLFLCSVTSFLCQSRK